MEKHNVLIFGETGTGKSSLINLLLGQHAATVSNRAIGCTFEFEPYNTPEKYVLFDAVGLSEGSGGSTEHTFAVAKLQNLLKSLENGVSLLVFVTKMGRITKSTQENYHLFVNTICGGKVPVIMVITHCELDMEDRKWYSDNEQYFRQYGMTFSEVISGCSLATGQIPPALNPDMIGPLTTSTANKLRQAISEYMLKPGWKQEGGSLKILERFLSKWASWTAEAGVGVWRYLGGTSSRRVEESASSTDGHQEN